jgi:hypothetical protein
MAWRLVLTAIALWWGYNAIQMFSCEYVAWSGRISYCTSSSGYPSGSSTGGSILVVVVFVLIAVWVSAFIQFRNPSQVVWEPLDHIDDSRYEEVMAEFDRQHPEPEPAPRTPTVEERLESLRNLHSIGVYTDEQYEALKKTFSDPDF